MRIARSLFDFSAGQVTDYIDRKNGNELLRARNIRVDLSGGFYKRNGTDLLTDATMGLNAKSDIWGYLLYTWNGQTGEGSSTAIYSILEKTEGSMTNLIWVDFGTDNLIIMGRFYAEWLGDATDGSYNTNYNYDNTQSITDRITSATISSGSLDADIAAEVTDLGDEAALAAATDKEMTIAELSTLTNEGNAPPTWLEVDDATYCIMGRWEQVGEKAGVSGVTDSYDLEEDILNSQVELSRRNTSTNARVLHRLATYYNATTGFIIETEHTGNALSVDSITEHKDDLWVDGKPDWAVYQNRAFMVNGVGDNVGTPDKRWTEGTNVFQIGLTAPAAAPTGGVGSDGSGYLGAGDYMIAYTYVRSTDYGAESVQSASDTITVTDGDSGVDDKITATVTYSADPQCDKIYKYRTKLGDTAFYYEASINNVVGTGTVAATWGGLPDNSLSTLADNSGLGDENERPPDANFLCVAANRMWYFTTVYGYYSKINELEHVPAGNIAYFDPDDGEDITNGHMLGNYMIVQKKTKTWAVDPNNPSYIAPQLLSNNIGTVAKRTFKVVGNGQEAIWLSQEGFYKTNAVQLASLTRNKIDKDLAKNIDYTRIAYAEAIYNPSDLSYYCYVPYLNDQYRVWVYSLLTESWVYSDYKWFRPHSMTLWTDEYGIKRVIIGCFIKGVELGRRSYFGHFIHAEKENWPKDVKWSSTCASSSVTYDAFPIHCITSWDRMGTEINQKYVERLHLYSRADETVAPTISVGADYGRQQVTISETIHKAIAGEPTEDDWRLGYDKATGWDYQNCEYQIFGVPEHRGHNLSVSYFEDSQKAVHVFGYNLYLEGKKEPEPERV